MLRCLLALTLLLLAPGCAAPEDTAGEAGSCGSAAFDSPAATGSLATGGGAPQEARRPARPGQGEIVPAGFTVLPLPALPRPRPAIVRGIRPLQCVPYARTLSGINLRGDAWTWWNKANGRYAKGKVPRPGAVLVLSKTPRLRRGHLAVVTEVRNSREIVVHQANWLNGGRIHRYTPVRDVSKNNDWSAVRVWYTPGRVWGAGTYAVYGFIYPGTDGLPELRQAKR